MKTPNKLLSFVDASRQKGIEWEELLGHAIDKRACLLAAVPESAKVWLGNSSDPKGSPIAPGKPLASPNLLRLEPAVCTHLRLHRNAAVKSSPLGFSTTSGNDVTSRRPQDAASALQGASDRQTPYGVRPRWDVWVVRPDGGFQVTPAQILITATEFSALAASFLDNAAHDGTWMSRDLQLLNEAARHFWYFWDRPDVSVTDKRTHPDQQKVEQWLSERGMAKWKLKAAASLIRPSFAPGGRSEK
jgi:hypothetical protein